MTTQNIPGMREEWDLIIRPRRAWWDLRLSELWKYRDLIRLLVWRDFVAAYKQTILGPLWHLIIPVISSLVYTVIFGNIAKLPTDGLPPFLFYMAGTTIWGYFSACLTSTSNTFAGNAGIFGKVYFPRLVMPISTVISNLISFTIRLSIFILFLVFFLFSGAGVTPNLWILILPLILFIMAGLGLGLGIIISSLTTKYRDLQQLLGFGVQLLMYGSPVIYPLSLVPTQWRWLLLANPLTPLIEMFRFAFLGTSTITPTYLFYSFGFMVIILMIGVLLFNRIENTFMDTV